MITSTAEQAGSPASASSDLGKPAKKAQARAQTRHAVAGAAKSTRKASPKQKADKGDKRARDGSKAAKVVDLLKRPSGITAKELMKATGWQPHSVRGFLSGTVRKKMGLKVISTKSADGERSYSVKA
jgi:hypothetical protein